MSRRTTLSRRWALLGLAALGLAVAGCSGGTPLRFALSTVNGVAYSPRKEDNSRPLAGATVRVFNIGANGALLPGHVSGSITTDGAGTFAVRDLTPGQLLVLQVTGNAPAAQDTTTTLTVSALVLLPAPPAPDQPPPPVATTVDLISDLAEGAALQLIAQGGLQPAGLTAAVLQALLDTSRQVATNNCLLPGQQCSGVVGGTTAPSRDDLIKEVIQQAQQTGVLKPPPTGGVGVIVR